LVEVQIIQGGVFTTSPFLSTKTELTNENSLLGNILLPVWELFIPCLGIFDGNKAEGLPISFVNVVSKIGTLYR
jgi:hypothetical protein